MAALAVHARDVAKRYRIGRRQVDRTLRETIVDTFSKPLRVLAGRRSHTPLAEDTVWALDGVSFEIDHGEIVGIIGRNGAGKSTLLKILSRITAPTRGAVDLYGRARALLEVGTGFHPELTGRENIYLSGAILGMRRAEITRKFDEMVAFAEIEQFLDTQVKHYSTGMFMRLAFAVAAHLEPEILLVDEVLAVGDASFQRKCLTKMEDVGRGGRTVLFVSHSIAAILRLCKRAILLDHGRIVSDGDVHEVVGRYLHSGQGSSGFRIWSTELPGDSIARLRSIRILDHTRRVVDTIDIASPMFVEVEYLNLAHQENIRPTVILHFTNEAGTCLFASNDFTNKDWWHTPRTPGIVTATCRVPGNFLAEGRLFVLVAIGTYNPNVIHAIEHDAVSFQVVDHTRGDGVRGEFVGEWPGLIRPMLDWQIAVRPLAE